MKRFLIIGFFVLFPSLAVAQVAPKKAETPLQRAKRNVDKWLKRLLKPKTQKPKSRNLGRDSASPHKGRGSKSLVPTKLTSGMEFEINTDWIISGKMKPKDFQSNGYSSHKMEQVFVKIGKIENNRVVSLNLHLQSLKITNSRDLKPVLNKSIRVSKVSGVFRAFMVGQDRDTRLTDSDAIEGIQKISSQCLGQYFALASKQDLSQKTQLGGPLALTIAKELNQQAYAKRGFFRSYVTMKTAELRFLQIDQAKKQTVLSLHATGMTPEEIQRKDGSVATVELKGTLTYDLRTRCLKTIDIIHTRVGLSSKQEPYDIQCRQLVTFELKK